MKKIYTTPTQYEDFSSEALIGTCSILNEYANHWETEFIHSMVNRSWNRKKITPKMRATLISLTKELYRRWELHRLIYRTRKPKAKLKLK